MVKQGGTAKRDGSRRYRTRGLSLYGTVPTDTFFTGKQLQSYAFSGADRNIKLLDLREEGLRIQENIFVSGGRRSGPQAQARRTARKN